MNRPFWKGKRVFLTGHTGFKGGWLALWLADMGAEVHGYALMPPTVPNLFTVTNLQSYVARSTIGDIRDVVTLTQAMQFAQPDIVLHLAAQPLVRYSYIDPFETYAVNVMGTVSLLEAVRMMPCVKAVINVTTDKCYENQEWVWAYRENEAIGGFDPYSSSKACSELVTAAYRRSYLEPSGIHIASARAGNVIGGGDWAVDRLIPDCLRAIDTGQVICVRSPLATRPWQHVLEPLSGYLLLAEKLFTEGRGFAEAWNFGSDEGDALTVQYIVEYLCAQAPNATWEHAELQQRHEAKDLKLDSSKAKALLGWYPSWNLKIALDMTLAWHQAWKKGNDMADICVQQIHEYEVAMNL